MQRKARRNDVQRSIQLVSDFLPEQVESLSKHIATILIDPEPPPTYQMLISVAVPASHPKHKRSVKTLEQYKRKKAQANVSVQVQEVD